MLTLTASIGASTLIARSTARTGLQRLEQRSTTFQRIGPARLDARVGHVAWPRELHPLAEAFDQMLSRLEKSFTRLSQFSADLAHELRTPIANILGEAQVSLTRERTAEEYRSVVESTVAECERLSRIANNLLFLARAESARERIQRTQFSGRAAIEKIANFYRTIAEDRKITVECEGSGTIDADPLLFARAVSNLVHNAMRFTPDGGRVRISISTKDHEGEVTVSDNGYGISPEHMPRVFNRFYRADPARSATGSGRYPRTSFAIAIARLVAVRTSRKQGVFFHGWDLLRIGIITLAAPFFLLSQTCL